MALQSTIHLAQLSGRPGDAAALRSRLSSIQRNFDRRLWSAAASSYRSPGYAGVTDDRGNALAVVSGLAPGSRYPALIATLRSERNASPYLELYVLRAMYAMGDAPGAQQRMRERYGSMIADPGYTLWENWDKSRGTDDHAWGGGPVYALGAYGIGLVPTEPGYAKYHLQPQLGSLKEMSMSVQTMRGTLAVRAANGEEGYELSLLAPGGTTGEVPAPVAEGGAVTVNGAVLYADGQHVEDVPGVQVVSETADSVTLRVQPGAWEIRSSTSQPRSGARNLSLLSR